jgi:O-antigen ligase
MNQAIHPSQRFGRPLLMVVLIELLLGGNGYLTQIAGIRLRVLLFIVCMTWVVVRLSSDSPARMSRTVWRLVALYLMATSTGILVGLVYGNSVLAIAAELKALLYFPMILFFALAIRDLQDVALVSKFIVVCGLIQAAVYMALMLSVHSGLVGYSTVYLMLRESDEFIFRHNPEKEIFHGFFYKGAFHLSVSSLFLLLDPVRKNFKCAALTIGALALTLTRGLIAAFLLSLFLGFALLRRNRLIAFLGLIGSLALLALIAHMYGALMRPESDAVRLADFHFIGGTLDPWMSFFGRGMGAPIGERERIEMTYLEVFYKQGVVGLTPWIAVLIVIFRAYRNISRTLKPHAIAFVLAAIYVYLATATNTFLTGSIGMSIVLLSMVSLLVMEQSGKRAVVPLQASRDAGGGQHA